MPLRIQLAFHMLVYTVSVFTQRFLKRVYWASGSRELLQTWLRQNLHSFTSCTGYPQGAIVAKNPIKDNGTRTILWQVHRKNTGLCLDYVTNLTAGYRKLSQTNGFAKNDLVYPLYFMSWVVSTKRYKQY